MVQAVLNVVLSSTSRRRASVFARSAAVVQFPASLLYTPTVWVWIKFQVNSISYLLISYLLYDKTKAKQKEDGVGQNKSVVTCWVRKKSSFSCANCRINLCWRQISAN